MTETKFTPAPWEQSHRKGRDEGYRTQVFPANDPDNTIATLHWHSVKTETGFRTDRDENAHLIAAAPDLYEALEDLWSWVRNWSPEFMDDDEFDRSKYESALAKARGEQS